MEEEKKEEKPETITLIITLPTKEKMIQTLTSLFPGVEVRVKEEKKPEEPRKEYKP